MDPAPPHPSKDLKVLQQRYLDTSLSLFERYRAMFGLREVGTADAVEVPLYFSFIHLEGIV